MDQEEHNLSLEDFKQEYSDAREAELFAKVLGQDPPATMKLPFSGRCDELLQTVQKLFPAATNVFIVDPAFRTKDGTPFMISFVLPPTWRDRAAQSIRSFTVTVFIEGDPKIGLSFAYLKINPETRRG